MRSCGPAGRRCPPPGDPQAEPTIGKAINDGYDLLEAKCNRCEHVSLVTLRSQHVQAFEPIQDNRIYIEKINGPFLFGDKATAAQTAPASNTRLIRAG